MQKAYDHSGEESLYQSWEKSGLMRADNQSTKPSFTIPLPPPNVTGQLHLGHAAMLAIEDILIRYKRMTGHEVLWIPGTDHAAIATENVVIKHHGKQSREDWPSREAFMQDARVFADEKHDTIINQMKRMGAWLDWSREAYTFDEARNQGVNEIFTELYEDGLIERGHRLINWSVGAQSVISDDELEWDQVEEPFYYIKCGKFIMGTVRPETKCADSPLVVHPDEDYVEIQEEGDLKNKSESYIIIKRLWDDQEKFFKTLNFLTPEDGFEVVRTVKGADLAGETFEAETYGGMRKFQVIADYIIDPDKGSGAMTISASHSADDYELAKRLKLDETFIQKIDFEGKMSHISGPCHGMKVEAARKEAGKIMEEKGLLVGKDKAYTHRVPLCYRSNCVIEPMISPQWFVMVEKEFTDRHTGQITTLKKLTQEAVRDNHVDIIPERFEKTYFQWIDNLRDWCISRQIWWGHRIPVWYDEDGKIVAVGTLSEAQEGQNLRQDQDTLDTWFSSALWPFSTLENPEDLTKFYPGDVLETGHDILFFWVARMIMFGRYKTGKYPFHTTYLHGMVTDEHGKKMSKSKGNGVDPLVAIGETGADSVRLALVIGSTPGNPIPIGENKIKGYRNFVNKLWNAGRFIAMQCENEGVNPQDIVLGSLNPQTLTERWIADRFTQTAQSVANNLDKFQISPAGDAIYHHVWGDFCDWYIEASKANPNPAFSAALYAEILKLTHPLCPFVTEQIWTELFGNEFLITENFPAPQGGDTEARQTFANMQELVGQIRSLRADNKLNPKEKLEVCGTSIDQEVQLLISVLAGVNFVSSVSEKAHKLVKSDLELSVEIPIDEGRKQAEITDLEKQIQALQGRLSNEKYVANAPEALVAESRAILKSAEEKLEKLKG